MTHRVSVRVGDVVRRASSVEMRCFFLWAQTFCVCARYMVCSVSAVFIGNGGMCSMFFLSAARGVRRLFLTRIFFVEPQSTVSNMFWLSSCVCLCSYTSHSIAIDISIYSLVHF